MTVLAIDPGNTYSAYCVMERDTKQPLEFGKIPNQELLQLIRDRLALTVDETAIEMVASYGMAVGKEVFDTVLWIGRFYEAVYSILNKEPQLIYRMEEKIHICHTSRAKDSNIRAALIDRFAQHDFKNGRGTKKNPDWFYGFHADIWAAYAVGLTFIETKMEEQ